MAMWVSKIASKCECAQWHWTTLTWNPIAVHGNGGCHIWKWICALLDSKDLLVPLGNQITVVPHNTQHVAFPNRNVYVTVQIYNCSNARTHTHMQTLFKYLCRACAMAATWWEVCVCKMIVNTVASHCSSMQLAHNVVACCNCFQNDFGCFFAQCD